MSPDSQMTFASASTTRPDVNEAGQALVNQITGQLEDVTINIALVFLSPHFRAVAQTLLDTLQQGLKPQVLLGSTAEGVIGREQEIEQEPAITLIAAHLPAVELTPFALQSMDWDNLLGSAGEFKQAVAAPENTKLFIVMADPFTTPIEAVLNAFNTFYAELPIIGGMASGSHRPGGNALLFNNRLLNNGAVGVAFSGNFDVDVIVSQGCRPIGQPFTVTHAQENIILSLEGEPPLVH